MHTERAVTRSAKPQHFKSLTRDMDRTLAVAKSHACIALMVFYLNGEVLT